MSRNRTHDLISIGNTHAIDDDDNDDFGLTIEEFRPKYQQERNIGIYELIELFGWNSVGVSVYK